MMQRQKNGQARFKQRGFSLFELALVIALVSVLLLAVLASSGKRRQLAMAERTVGELNTIVSACTQYYSVTGAWPANLSELRPGYLATQSSDSNPFGNAYTITAGVSSVSVSTLLPKGLVTRDSFGSEMVVVSQGNNDLVSVTKLPESRNWNLKHDKKYLYEQ